jgi:fructan beta-fructosidase
MNNWKYANALPTHPWRGAMSIPRSLILEHGTDGLQLAQEPIETLRRLRGRHHRFDAREIAEVEADLSDQLAGESLEIVAEFEPGTATEFGLKVRKGASEETLVGYDAAGKRLFVDRTRSGDVSIHPEFRERHAGPLAPSSGRVRLHLFVDTSSVEVFGNRGQIVITDLIFPDPASRGLALYAKGGAARLVGLDVWELAPAWRPTPD